MKNSNPHSLCPTPANHVIICCAKQALGRRCVGWHAPTQAAALHMLLLTTAYVCAAAGADAAAGGRRRRGHSPRHLNHAGGMKGPYVLEVCICTRVLHTAPAWVRQLRRGFAAATSELYRVSSTIQCMQAWAGVTSRKSPVYRCQSRGSNLARCGPA